MLRTICMSSLSLEPPLIVGAVRVRNWRAAYRRFAVDLVDLGGCAQNVEAEYFQQSLQPELAPLGYKGKFAATPGGGVIGVATFWNTGTFKLLKVRLPPAACNACHAYSVRDPTHAPVCIAQPMRLHMYEAACYTTCFLVAASAGNHLSQSPVITEHRRVDVDATSGSRRRT